jgi:sigma-B regulation protein RsbU (phosphoserine phosphatase)
MLSAPDARDPYESAACGLLTLTVDGTIERVNATLCKWLGWDASELTAKRRFQDLLTVGSKLFHQTHWFPLLQLQGSVAEVQIELVHRDSHTLPALVNAALYFPDSSRERKDGRVQVAIFIATDRRKYERELLLARRRAEELLTSEREAQKARSLAEARLRLALDSASLYTWQVELPGGAITYERQVGALLGRPDAQDVSPDEFASSLHPADREREAAAFAMPSIPPSALPISQNTG